MNLRGIEHEVENFMDQEEIISYLAYSTEQTNHQQYGLLKKQTRQGLVQAIEEHVNRTKTNSYNQAQFSICNDLQTPYDQKKYVQSICNQLQGKDVQEKAFTEPQKEALFAQTITAKFQTYLNQTITQRLGASLTGVRQ